MHFPVAFRNGGPSDRYGIWFSFIHGQQDFLLDPMTLCSCLNQMRESDPGYYDPFLPAEDDDFPPLPSVRIKADSAGRTMSWDIECYTRDGIKSVFLDFDLNSVCTGIEDSIAALYNRFVTIGGETAYDGRLSLSDMGEVMLKMLSSMHVNCRETARSLVCEDIFDLKFRETDCKDCGGVENLLEVTVRVGRLNHVFTVDRNSFNFKCLRHELENFMYHGEAHLVIPGYEESAEIVIGIKKRFFIDETIPLNAGTFYRHSPILIVTVEERYYDEKETKVFGICDIIPTLKSLYFSISDIAGFYAGNNDKKEKYDKDVWREEFMSKDFIDYLLSEKKGLHDNATFIRNHYAYSETEVTPEETIDEYGEDCGKECESDKED